MATTTTHAAAASLLAQAGQTEPACDASTVEICLIFAHGASGIVVDRVARLAA